MEPPAPLAGLRIVAVEQFGAGPFATLYLADMGADVIKIEDPGQGGDVGRSIPPGARDGQSLYFETFSRGKRSVALDLKSASGRAVFERIVAGADVVFNNLRGDQAERLGLTYDALKHVNPRIVCASLSAYDRGGERAAEPGYDPLVQAEAGWAMLTGEPGGPPVRSGLPLADYIAGLSAALAIMIALHRVSRTGRGCDADTNLYDVATAMLNYQATWQLSAGVTTGRQPMGAHPSIVPFQFFGTRDGYIAVACAKEKFFRALVAAMGEPQLADDPRFATFAARRTNREELLDLLARRFLDRSTEDWLHLLRGQVPVAPVRSLEEALDPAELEGRGMLARYPHPLFGEVRAVGTPITLSDFRPHYRRAPTLGEHTAEVLRHTGVDPEDLTPLE